MFAIRAISESSACLKCFISWRVIDMGQNARFAQGAGESLLGCLLSFCHPVSLSWAGRINSKIIVDCPDAFYIITRKIIKIETESYAGVSLRDL